MQYGETLDQVAARYGVETQTLMDVNHLPTANALMAGDRLLVPQQARTHTVATGESIYSIAADYGVRRADLIAANNIENPDYLRTGQVLQIPLTNQEIEAARTWTPPAPQPVAEPVQALGQPQVPAQGQIAAAPIAGPTVGGGTVSSGSVEAVPLEGPSGTALPPVTSGPPAGGQVAGGPIPQGIDSELIAHQEAAPFQPSTDGQPGPGVGLDQEVPPSGQVAALPPAQPVPAATTTAQFQWPVRGDLIPVFDPADRARFDDGMNIVAPAGTPILASRDGTVVYAGNELRGYGNLVIVRHADGWVTAYAHANELMVERGDTVRAGQQIATVGQTGAVSSPQLHFEIRRGSDPVNPLDHLPSHG
ncbi:MAG: peptidoglycan DD-metalloendopeptidase family protein [Rhodospirillaceae bacterium]|nr:peptidoglycan DD-metalloendopeptidase family protein [Rhodospirillaceae bacterium]MCA8932125.1 peptidoglycan DD-metalloendopeptidase family protein [Rhodospirillaceae bacterium]